ncbi:hypothetical protein WDJ51_13260 [Rathayibacter sp. YIM 133350]|uniref:hypothetical protein n=1 Tax=Rathayibacter sp. YIM 133350 TaxID=3131992 RepID=UPI00307DBA3B
MNDAATQLQLLERLRAAVEEAAVTLADEPRQWRSPAERAFRDRLHDLRHSVASLAGVLEAAIEQARIRAAGSG